MTGSKLDDEARLAEAQLAESPSAAAQSANPSVVLPRAALERVLARATELQTQGADTPEVISESRLLDIGREVGINPDHLRQAIAEERSRTPWIAGEEGAIARTLGPAHVDAQRTVPGTPEALLVALDQWMQREEKLVVKRRFAGRLSWEQRNDPFGSLLRSFGTGRADLARADEISAVVTAVDGARSVVRLDADLRAHRQSQRNAVVVLGVLNGVIAAGWITVLAIVASTAGGNGAPLILPIGAGVITGAAQLGIAAASWRAIRSAFRGAVTRTQLRLEQLLDALEHGPPGSPPSMIEQLRRTLLG